MDILRRFKDNNDKQLLRSMLLAAILKPIGLLLSLLYTPLVLRYLGDELYGLWATIISVVSWISYLDIGIGNGLRNRIVVDIEKKDRGDVKRSVSTAYWYMSCIMIVVSLVLIGLICCTNVNAIMNVSYDCRLRPVLIISVLNISLNLVLALCKSEIYAVQKAEINSILQIVTQVINIVLILIALGFFQSSLLIVSGIVFISNSAANIIGTLYIGRLDDAYLPRIKDRDRSLFKEICSMGLQFFVIQICGLILFSTDKYIITFFIGPSAVTPYDISQKAFTMVNLVFTAFITPLWSKFTKEAQNGNYTWIKSALTKISLLSIPVLGIHTVLYVFYQRISNLWLGTNLFYPMGLVLCMYAFYCLSSLGGIFSVFLNGIGQVKELLVSAVVTAVINIPLSIFLAIHMKLGSTGVILATVICTIINNGVALLKSLKIIHENISKGDSL